MHIIGAQDIDGVQTNYSLYSGILDDYHSNFIWDYRDDFSIAILMIIPDMGQGIINPQEIY